MNLIFIQNMLVIIIEILAPNLTEGT